MKVLMLDSIGTAAQSYSIGETHDLSDAQAKQWIAQGLCSLVTEEPSEIPAPVLVGVLVPEAAPEPVIPTPAPATRKTRRQAAAPVQPTPETTDLM